MFKTATVLCVGLCLLGAPALAGTPTASAGAVTMASASGLYVRVTSPAAVARVSRGNVCGAAVNTAGITRATTAVKVGGRIFLTGGGSKSLGQMPAVAFHTPQTDSRLTRKSPQGLGTLLARVFGLVR